MKRRFRHENSSRKTNQVCDGAGQSKTYTKFSKIKLCRVSCHYGIVAVIALLF